MKKTWVVVTDLGSCKTYRLEWTHIQQTPRLELADEFRLVEAHGKLTDKVTDPAGRYRVPTTNMAMSYGENHKIEAEMKRRLIHQIAQRLNSFFKDQSVEAFYLAADKEIYRHLLSQLDPHIQVRIEKGVSADLTKARKDQILDHFLTTSA